MSLPATRQENVSPVCDFGDMSYFLRVALATMAAFALGGTGNLAGADQYPTKPIRFVALYPPGSVTDMPARVIAQKLTEKWGQSVTVGNRGGGGSQGAHHGRGAGRVRADGDRPTPDPERQVAGTCGRDRNPCGSRRSVPDAPDA